MAALCPVCKTPTTEALVTVRGKKMCVVCLEAKKSAAKAKDAKLAAKLNDPDRKAIEQFILALWSLDAIPTSVSRQLDLFAPQYRYADMLYALHYFYHLEGKEIPDEPTIGIIPYIIREALAHKRRLASAAEANATFVVDNQPETITIHHRSVPHQFLGYSMEDL